MNNSLTLKIGGFNIKTVFNKSEKPFVRDTIKNEIIDFFKGFIIKNPNNKPDYTINFIEKKRMDLLYNGKGKKYYLGFFEETGVNSMNAYYSINPLQFQTVINFILFKLSLKHETLFLKSIAIEKNGKAEIFFKDIENIHNKFLTDDISIIKKENGRYYFYQSPFIENPFIEKNHGKFPIGNIYIPLKSKNISEGKIEDKEQILENLAKKISGDSKNYNSQIKYLMEFVKNFDNFYYIK